MLRTLTHAVIHVVALWRDDPVLPLDVTELDVEVFLTAHAGVLATLQRTFAQGVSGAVVTQPHLGD